MGIYTKDITDKIENILTDTFSYAVEIIDISRDIIPLFNENEVENSIGIVEKMNIGNELREKYGNDFFAKIVATKISVLREKRHNNNFRKKVAYIISSLKHPDEVTFFRDLYSKSFVLFGVLRNVEDRRRYIKEKYSSFDIDIEKLLERDKNENLDHGQKFRNTFYLSDFFVNYSNEEALKNQFERFFKILFGNSFYTPTFDEVAMYSAFSASLRSSDLARQVGAVISKNNEIIAQGANDVPKYKGGLYWPTIEKDYKIRNEEHSRDFTIGYDTNKHTIFKIYEDVISHLELDNSRKEEYIEKLEKTKIRSLTEFGRTVHAEMEAISMCARTSVNSKDATLYCTTFPCHNCTKHIVSSGIVRVVYVEPYPKSLAYELYNDSIYINENLDDVSNIDKVVFEPFIGVGQRLFYDLFSISYSDGYNITRKDDFGNVLDFDPKKAQFRFSNEPYSYIEKETKLISEISKLVN